MISTRRIVAAACLAAGVTGFAAPLANAAEATAPADGKLSPIAVLDSLATSDIPAEYRREVPSVREQLSGLGKLNDLNQLHQLTDLAAPVTGLLPAVE
ncbi:hypothetical protein ACFV0T_21660 [Streptomyces sp. NPDC059582]|uniref:hypothetical protein n=1 Tax=Streptomyces sp. NPDC059582 TaxID=3346875 RepID=UPI0036B3C9E2